VTVRRFIAGIFTLIGWLLALLSGGCSLYVGLVGVMRGGALNANVLLFLLIVFGVPFLIGLGLVGIGRLIRGRPEQDQTEDIANVFGESGGPRRNPLRDRPATVREGAIPNPLKRKD
jgi:hypothetical protein